MAQQLFVALFALWMLVAGDPSMAVERPFHSVEISEPPYEIREYGPTLVALVHVEGGRSEGVGAGFRILAHYIFGGNRANGKIAMTAPVTQTRSPDIAATPPGAAIDADSPHSGWIVRFAMPSAYSMSSLPAPSDPRVRIVEMPGRRVACIKFSGFWSDANFQSNEAKLRQWLASRKFVPTSVATYAYYDPPWTPWFMRTNEVLIDISTASR